MRFVVVSATAPDPALFGRIENLLRQWTGAMNRKRHVTTTVARKVESTLSAARVCSDSYGTGSMARHPCWLLTYASTKPTPVNPWNLYNKDFALSLWFPY